MKALANRIPTGVILGFAQTTILAGLFILGLQVTAANAPAPVHDRFEQHYATLEEEKAWGREHLAELLREREAQALKEQAQK